MARDRVDFLISLRYEHVCIQIVYLYVLSLMLSPK